MARTRTSIGYVIIVIVVALIVAAVCRATLLELYTVAPQQMENTLLPGDRVMVEKWHYGVRLPQSYLAIPHLDTLPATHTPARIPALPLPYRRWGTTLVGRNDVVVYNYPMQLDVPLSLYPTAIARCVGLPGDTLQACDGSLRVNGVELMPYYAITQAYLIADTLLPQVEKAALSVGKLLDVQLLDGQALLYLDRGSYNKLCTRLPEGVTLNPVSLSHDDYEVELPPYGSDAVITPTNASFYAEIINRYEPRKVELHGDALYRGGRKITSYRFTQPYYWVLCDNRTATADSRTVGVVPHSHLIGKCGMILFSIDAQQRGFSSWRTQRFFQYRKL